MIQRWSSWDLQEAMDHCTGSSFPETYVIDHDMVIDVQGVPTQVRAGDVMPMCIATGVVYAPPFSMMALAELLFPNSWSITPPQ